MESSEDDAGAATNASRRISARENNMGQVEDVDASTSFQRDSSEDRTSCKTHTMSEDNFDGDSVPSPSTQDVNTSTEAILDMIDEFVDGPGAPKRLSVVEESKSDNSTSYTSNIITKSEPIDVPVSSVDCCPSSIASKQILIQACTSGIQVGCTSQSETSDDKAEVYPSEIETLEVSPMLLQEQSEVSLKPYLCNENVAPSSNELKTLPNVCESLSEPRTVKCTTSSENQDKVTIESAESTSNDSNISEGKCLVTDSVTRSPLRRRLVRPPPVDRRPDSTVSSTGDSEIFIQVGEPGECVTKDVSSSSDAVPTVHGNIKEKVSNISEISVCKAETSDTTNPPKKIKLIRQKIMPSTSQGSDVDKQIITQIEQCQSTSDNFMPESENIDLKNDSSLNLDSKKNCNTDNKVNVHDNDILRPATFLPNIDNKEEKSVVKEECHTDDNSLIMLDVAEEHAEEAPARVSISKSLTIEAISVSNKPSNIINTSESSEKVPPLKLNLSISNISDTSEVINPHRTDAAENITDKVPPLKLNLTATSTPEKLAQQTSFIEDRQEKVSPLKLQFPSNVVEHKSNFPDTKIEKVPPLKLNISSSNLLISSNTLEDTSNIIDSSIHKSNLDNKTDKVPPLKLNLNVSSKIEIDSVDQNMSCENKSEKIPTLKLNISSINSLESDIKSGAQCSPTNINEVKSEKVPPLKINLSMSSLTETSKDMNDLSEHTYNCDSILENKSDSTKQVPKLTIKLGSKQPDEMKSPIPKVTIKPVKPSSEELEVKECKDPVPCITKLNIKPILRPPEKINDIHRKSSSSEISESEYSETDDTTSTSDQASTSDHGPPDVVPKVTIRLGKPGTESEGKFYAEQSSSIKEYQLSENEEKDSSISKLKLVVSQSEESHIEKIPKLTIKTISKSENQPLSPKLLIKALKPPDSINKDSVLDQGMEPKCSADEINENVHTPKITIKPIIRTESPIQNKFKKSSISSSSDQFPVVTKINIKPILKPDHIETTDNVEEKVPVISKLNIKPVMNPVCKENDEEVPKITKLNIKPLRSLNKDDAEWNADNDKDMPFITKLNIKPISKSAEIINDSDNLSPETGNSSDENTETLPIVTKLNIKPILKPESDEKHRSNKNSNEAKINIKPVINPCEDTETPNDENMSRHDIKSLKSEELHDTCNFENTQPKNPPLIMKINRSIIEASSSDIKQNHIDCLEDSNACENFTEESKIKLTPLISPTSRENENIINSLHGSNNTTEIPQVNKPKVVHNCTSSVDQKQKTDVECKESRSEHKTDFFPVGNQLLSSSIIPSVEIRTTSIKSDIGSQESQLISSVNSVENLSLDKNSELQNLPTEISKQPNLKHKTAGQNCFLLKQLLESNKGLVQRNIEENEKNINSLLPLEHSMTIQKLINFEPQSSIASTKEFDLKHCLEKSIQDSVTKQNSPMLISEEKAENLSKPLEINVSEQINQNSGQDSPRIILKINKTDHGPSAKIITEDGRRPDSPLLNSVDLVNDKASPKKGTINSRRKISSDKITSSLVVGKRLRSSRIVHDTDKSPIMKRNIGRKSVTSTSPTESKEPEFSNLDSKRIKLGQLLSNKALTVSPVISKVSNIATSNVNHSILNNENCSKNGNSKLHDILSNLQAKQKIDTALKEKQTSDLNLTSIDYNTSGTNSDIIEIDPVENSHPQVQEMIINENTLSHDFILCDESTDPLEVESSKFALDVTNDSSNIPKTLEITPTPKKRGRPRKIPLTDGPKTIVLPTPALEERPQRSLRLSRDRPAILAKPRGRGRGRGLKRGTTSQQQETETAVETANKFFAGPENKLTEENDPTSSRVKLPRMTEALDKMPSCTTPLSSRRRNSSSSDLKLFSDAPELKVVLENTFMKSPECTSASGGERRGRGMRGRGSRGGRGRSPRGRGRGRGGGRGAVYMKETMGIYGRVCGPATTTVQLFEEETCMMDDNATPSKPSHLIDEDSQSSVRSSTNESSKMRKSKFADLFDSNKIWTAADVKEYVWPPTAVPDAERQVMMIQEQVAMFLGIKSFKRRYPELKRRSIVGEEKDYVLSRSLATEALCDLGITAVDASEILDIMLSDYPHKYEEYRSHQRERQLNEATTETVEESQPEEKVDKVEIKMEQKIEMKPEAPKVDPEKTRQDMAAAAVAAASEWNARLNAQRRGACVDLQSLTVLRPRAPPAAPRAPHCRPPAGFYPHALLPGQYHHWYRCYTPEQLRYFPLNTVMSAPPPAPEPDSSSDSEPDWSSSDQDSDTQQQPKRRKLMKKRTSQGESSREEKECKETKENEADLCRVCKLREEGNRKYSHERFLVCSNCNAKLHPGCVELSADTIRKCREYAWQCADCKWCCACRRPADDDKMLFCDLCDRGFHIYCVGLHTVPNGRWHCVECAVCKSCGAREPAGPAGAGAEGGAEPPAWHHQTRRGPGGHKLYSHSLCTPCARAYRIGRYCPLCDRSFVGPKGTMQLVICKLCDRQLHQDCVKQTVSHLNVLDYTCGECRRGGITSRAAAARLAPRTIATLFMAKRRFNKYAHRQYMESRRAPPAPPAPADPLANDSAD